MENVILEPIRRMIIDELTMLGCISGQLEFTEFIKRVFPKISEMSSTDPRYTTAEEDIR